MDLGTNATKVILCVANAILLMSVTPDTMTMARAQSASFAATF